MGPRYQGTRGSSPIPLALTGSPTLSGMAYGLALVAPGRNTNQSLKGIYLGEELLDHMVTLCLTFWEIARPFFQSGRTIIYPQH